MSTKPLWKHQAETKKFFSAAKSGFDLSDPGTGKTRCQVESFQECKTRNRMLVVAPKTLMYCAWGADIEQYAPNLTVSYANAGKRIDAFNIGTDVVVINTDGVKELTDKQYEKLLKQFTHLVVDESTAFKNPSAQRSKALKKIVKNFSHIRMLTGTPNPNTVMELFFPALLIDGGKRLGTSYTALRNNVQTPTQIGPKPQHVRWDDKPGAAQAMREILADITIRHAFEDVMKHVPPNYRETKVFELSRNATKQYMQMEMTCMLQAETGDISAVHAASLRTKLLQIACIEEGTEVLTLEGWKKIETVTAADKVWDGEAWASTLGGKYSGYKPVIACYNVNMTPDHKVLTLNGWATAEEIKHGDANGRFNRPEVRAPDGFEMYWDKQPQKQAMADAVRLRKPSSPNRIKFKKPYTISRALVWLQQRRSTSSPQKKPRPIQQPAIQPMDKNKIPLLLHWRQRLQKLRRSWNWYGKTMAKVREFSQRYDAYLQRRVVARSNKQQQKLFKKELPLGDASRAGQQHAIQPNDTDAARINDCVNGSAKIQPEIRNFIRSNESQRFEPSETCAHVWDVAQVTPLHRFTIRNKLGEIFIVHNSGAVYTGGEEGEYIVIDKQRYELIADLVEGREHSVVFFNWKHQRDLLSEEFDKRKISYAIIDGNVKQAARDAIVKAYQNGEYQTLLLHPRTGAHGLTLTRGTTTIISSPIYEADMLKQAIHRIYRGDQKCVTNTILIEAKNTVEAKVYTRLNDKFERMIDLLDLMKR